MSITLSGGSGLFDRLGKIGRLFDLVNTFRATNSSGYLPYEIKAILDLYNSASNELREAVGGLLAASTSGDASLDALQRALQTAARQTLIETAHADVALPTKSLAEALDELWRQMIAGSATVDASEPSASVTMGTNTGTGKVLSSLIDGRGRTLENVYDESIVGRCTSAASSSFLFQGEKAARSKLAGQWPLGSGLSTNVLGTDASADPGLTSGGALETWSANIPSGWTLATGTAGTHFGQETSTKYKGSAGAKFIGDGSTLTSITQAIATSRITPWLPYAVCFWVKTSAAPAAGVLTVDLYDGASVIADEAGTNNSFTVDLTSAGLAAAWTAQTGVFRLPDPLPSAVTLRVRLSTALSASRTLYLDELTVKPMTKLSPAGPYLAVFNGATAWALADSATIAVTNARAGKFQTLFQRLFDTDQTGFLLPSATGGAETIADYS